MWMSFWLGRAIRAKSAESDSYLGVISQPEIVGFPHQSLDTSGQTPLIIRKQ
jgi:hypothetical protein